MAQLRTAGLITVSGQARGVTYALAREGIGAGRDILQGLLDQ
jgi:hypothetical protein